MTILSEVACLLRHRDVVTSYIPIHEDHSDEEIAELSRQKRIGKLYCDVVFLEGRPKVRRLKLNVTGAVLNREAEYSPAEDGG